MAIDITRRNLAAKYLQDQETFQQAIEAVHQSLVSDLLSATTPEDREQKWHGIDGLRKARARIAKWAADAPKP